MPSSTIMLGALSNHMEQSSTTTLIGVYASPLTSTSSPSFETVAVYETSTHLCFFWCPVIISAVQFCNSFVFSLFVLFIFLTNHRRGRRTWIREGSASHVIWRPQPTCPSQYEKYLNIALIRGWSDRLIFFFCSF